MSVRELHHALHLSRIGPAVAQQDAHAPSEGEAAGRSQGADAPERDLADRFRPRPAGGRAEDAGVARGRPLLAVLTGDRSKVQLSRRGRAADP